MAIVILMFVAVIPMITIIYYVVDDIIVNVNIFCLYTYKIATLPCTHETVYIPMKTVQIYENMLYKSRIDVCM